MADFSLITGVSGLKPPPAAPAPSAPPPAAKVPSPPFPHHCPDSLFAAPSKSPGGLSTTGTDTDLLSQTLHTARCRLTRLTN